MLCASIVRKVYDKREALTFFSRKVKRAILAIAEGVYVSGVKLSYSEGCSFHLALIRLFITEHHLITVQDDLAP